MTSQSRWKSTIVVNSSDDQDIEDADDFGGSSEECFDESWIWVLLVGRGLGRRFGFGFGEAEDVATGSGVLELPAAGAVGIARSA